MTELKSNFNKEIGVFRKSCKEFVHLRVHSEYSIIDSIVRIDELMTTLVAADMQAVGIAEYCNFFSAVKFYQAAIKNKIKPLLGVDLPCCYRNAPQDVDLISLICLNDVGYKKATELVSKAYLEGQVNGEARVFYEWLPDYTEGLICLSGASFGLIGKKIESGRVEDARKFAQYLASLFKDRFYLEIQRVGRKNEHINNKNLVAIADELQLPLVATQEVRFLRSNEHEAHEIRVCIHDGCTLEANRLNKRYTQEQYLKTTDEMVKLFADLPQALENTVEISKRCNVKLQLGTIHLPTFNVPKEVTEGEYLTALAKSGLILRLEKLFAKDEREAKRPLYEQRLNLELKVIQAMGFSGYFLIVADFIGWAKKEDIAVGPGRGSGAGSLVAYALKITDLDPITYDLLFERFLNPERVSLPDFDVDFCMQRRDAVIDYVAHKYGRNNVSQIITFGTMAAKAVIRDVGRVLGQPYGFVDKLAKLIPFELGITLEKALKETPSLLARYEEEDEVKELFDLALILEGLVRNPGKHAGGVVIAPSALTDFTAIYCESHSNQILSQFDKDDVETVGLVKFDFLGLKTLTIIDWALKTINAQKIENQEEPIDIAHINLDCPETFAFLQSCKTTAIFQLESRGMKDLVFKLKPDSFEEIIALVALFRPGPLQSGMVDDFIKRKHGQEEVVYLHPLLAPILKATYGVILYQEQVMQIAQNLANYTLGAADLLRRAMGKKKPEEMAKQRAIFIDGAAKSNIDHAISGQLFDLMEKFAGYGFNKSHSAAYALIAYQTAWLKTHFPAEFMAAVLSADLDNTDKLSLFIEDIKQIGLTILPPCVAESDYVFLAVDRKTIRYGLGAIKGIGEGAVIAIKDARLRGKFKSLFAFCELVDLKKVNRRALDILIKSGAMDVCGEDRGILIKQLDEAILRAEQIQGNKQQGQLDLFSNLEEKSVNKQQNNYCKYSNKEKLFHEKAVLGLYLSGHPTTDYYHEMINYCSLIGDLNPSTSKKGRVCALVVATRMIVSKNGRRFAIVSLEDSSARFDVLFSLQNYQNIAEILTIDNIVIVEGDIMQDEYTKKAKMVGTNAYSIENARGVFSKGLILKLVEPSDAIINNLKDILKSKPGYSAVEMHYKTAKASSKLKLGDEWRVTASDDLLMHLKILLGESNVELSYGFN